MKSLQKRLLLTLTLYVQIGEKTMKHKILLSLILVIPATVLMPRNAIPAQKTIEVQVTAAPDQRGEYRIESSLTQFKVGVKYRLVMRNAGRKLHEILVIPRGESNSLKALVAVEEDYFRPNDVVVRNVVFPKPGEYEFSCHVGKHYENGMVLPIVVQ
jgi:uncharacterized cupredoxin-like copper-binding protein